MSPRDIFALALRIIGAWALVEAAGGIVQTATFISSSTGLEEDVWVSIGYSWIAWSVMAAVAFLFAPTIASWFYRDGISQQPNQSHAVHVDDVYQIAVRLFGMYCWFKALEPIAYLLRMLHESVPWKTRWQYVKESEYLSAVIVYVVGGALLVVGAERIASVLAGSPVRGTRGDGGSRTCPTSGGEF